MATDYKIVVVPDTGGTRPCSSVWVYTTTICTYSINNTAYFRPGTTIDRNSWALHFREPQSILAFHLCVNCNQDRSTVCIHSSHVDMLTGVVT